MDRLWNSKMGHYFHSHHHRLRCQKYQTAMQYAVEGGPDTSGPQALHQGTHHIRCRNESNCHLKAPNEHWRRRRIGTDIEGGGPSRGPTIAQDEDIPIGDASYPLSETGRQLVLELALNLYQCRGKPELVQEAVTKKVNVSLRQI